MSIELDPAVLAVAKQTLTQLMQQSPHPLVALSLSDALYWLETQLPRLDSVALLLTWATAIEQFAAALSETETLWQQALNTEAYMLRLRARDFATAGNTYTP